MSQGTKLWVGNLAWGTTKESLRDEFSKHGELIDWVVMIDKETGKSRGFGFVTYQHQEDAMKAISSRDNTELEGRMIRVNFANAKPQPGGGSGYGGGQGGGAPSGGYGGGSGGGGGGGYGQQSYQGGYGGQGSYGGGQYQSRGFQGGGGYQSGAAYQGGAGYQPGTGYQSAGAGYQAAGGYPAEGNYQTGTAYPANYTASGAGGYTGGGY